MNNAVLHQHIGEVRDFLFYECLLQFDGRCGDGNGHVLLILLFVIYLRTERRHQIRKGFTSSNLCFTDCHLLFGKADKHFLCEANLFLSDGVSVLGEDEAENGFNDFHRIVGDFADKSLIAGVFDGINNIGD